MRRLYGCDRAAVLLTVALVGAGCGGGGDAGGGGGGGGGGGADPAASPVDAATAGNIGGMIMFDGAAPTMDMIDMASEAVCAGKYTSTPTTEEVVVGTGGGLANVFVYVKEGLDASLSFPTPGDAVVIDQDGCRYIPHVIAVQAGQDITFRNSDGLLHNINASPTENRGFNVSQPVNMETNRNFAAAEVMVPVRCDVHGWMSAYIGVLDHPFHAVSGPDGSVDLSTLPPGDYVIEAWHERYGTQTANVTVATGQTADVSFTFNESMALDAVVPMGDPIDPHDHGSASVADPSAGDAR